MSNKKILLLAVIFGLLTALALNFYLNQVKNSVTMKETRKIVVAAVVIPAKTIVTKEMVTLQDVPADFVHPSAMTDINQVVGSITNADMIAGESVLKEKLLMQKSSQAGLSNLIPLGMRAVSIPVNEVTGVSGLIMPGDRVDLIGTVDIDAPVPAAAANGQQNAAGAQKVTVTHVLMQNVEVLAVGQSLQPQATNPAGDKKAAEPSATVTLAVEPDKVQAVAMILEKGKLSLTLRSPADRGIHNRPLFRDVQLLK